MRRGAGSESPPGGRRPGKRPLRVGRSRFDSAAASEGDRRRRGSHLADRAVRPGRRHGRSRLPIRTHPRLGTTSAVMVHTAAPQPAREGPRRQGRAWGAPLYAPRRVAGPGRDGELPVLCSLIQNNPTCSRAGDGRGALAIWNTSVLAAAPGAAGLARGRGASGGLAEQDAATAASSRCAAQRGTRGVWGATSPLRAPAACGRLEVGIGGGGDETQLDGRAGRGRACLRSGTAYNHRSACPARPRGRCRICSTEHDAIGSGKPVARLRAYESVGRPAPLLRSLRARPQRLLGGGPHDAQSLRHRLRG
jgi:hypothetical protein